MSNRTARADDAGLTAEDFAALRRSLQEQRRFRLEQLARMTRHAPPRAPERATAPAARDGGGPAVRDGSAPAAREGSAARREVRAALTASARMVLHDVEAALERMDQGRYGSCQLCAGPIGLRRLTIVPQARYCGRCHQARETRR
ncbi:MULTISPECIES: TraR/DksA C4-type zinc finger protein [unclassified Streptomyces]|uniref:TraR/DksA family transcriptional regulator n=1 Tax=unclassified Streptomyces TaxID=2593676 RepID=UPI00331EFA47